MATRGDNGGNWFDQNPLPAPSTIMYGDEPHPVSPAPSVPVTGGGQSATGKLPPGFDINAGTQGKNANGETIEQGGPSVFNAASWWNPSDPKGSIMALLQGKPLTSQTILSLKPYFDQVGIQISPANAEGITSKIMVPGVGWVRVGDGGVKGADGGSFTGWTWMPQGDGAGGGGEMGMGAGFGSFAQPYGKDFSAPTAEQARNTPGYQFKFDQGLKAVQGSAASKGTLLTGGTLKAIDAFGTGLADSTYQQTYNNALGEYMNSYNMWRNNQNDVWGRNNDVADRGLKAANEATS